MKKILKILLILCLIFQLNNGFENNLCSNEDGLKCESIYHSFKCGSHHCADNFKTCMKYYGIKFMSNMDKKYDNSGLDSKIKKCSNIFSFKWDANQVCEKPLFCSPNVYPKNYKPILSHIAFRQSSCRCQKPFSIECDSGYCSLDSRACHKIDKKQEIKKCF